MRSSRCRRCPADVPAPVARLIVWLLEKDPAPPPARLPDGHRRARPAPRRRRGRRRACDMRRPQRRSAATALSASLLAAARAALELGRTKRVHVAARTGRARARRAAGCRPAFVLASSIEESRRVSKARAILEAIAADATGRRMIARWRSGTLGRLAEKESAAALDRARSRSTAGSPSCRRRAFRRRCSTRASRACGDRGTTSGNRGYRQSGSMR